MASGESKTEDRQRFLAAPVELRVHGVGGTTPEVLLSHPHPVQVAGDDTAGFYRSPDSDALEAYSWGGITSRAGSRALWLLLLPFALANAAGFMLATRKELPRVLLRLLALSVTAMAALWATGIGIDLIAYQCGSQPDCRDKHWWLSFFDNPFFAGSPIRRMVIGLLVPVTLIATWRLATRLSRTRYEEAFNSEPVESDEIHSGDLSVAANLTHRQFWHSATFTARLASAHFACATSLVVAALSLGTGRLRSSQGLGVTFDRLTFLAAVAVTVVGAIVTAAAGRGPGRPAAIAGWVLLGSVAVVNLIRPGPIDQVLGDQVLGDASPGALPGYSRPALAVGLLSLLLAVALMVSLLVAQTDLARTGTFLPVATTALAMWTMVSLQAGSHVRIADWLGERLPTPQTAVIGYSFAYDWFALASLALVFAILVTVLIAYLSLRRRISHPAEVERVAKVYPELTPDLEGVAWLRRIVRARALAGLTDQAATALLAMLSLLLGGAIAFYGVRAFVSGSPLDAIGPMPATWKSLVPAASWIGSLLPLAALVIMYRSFRDPGTRRRVGVLWDILTFWPRWFHPLAPPPYSARAVPELGIRLERLTEEGARVVISGHSQGSVLAVASLARLPAEVRSKIALLTHGSPLGRLYGKFFPSYFGPTRLAELSDRVGGRWTNLFRLTDPIGGPVGVGDLEIRDPSSASRQPGDPLPPIKGHTFYRGPEVDAATAALAHRIDPV